MIRNRNRVEKSVGKKGPFFSDILQGIPGTGVPGLRSPLNSVSADMLCPQDILSAIINNKGEIIKKLNATEAGNIQYEVPLIESKNRNKNDLIFFVLLITYIFIFRIYKTNK